MKDFPSKLQNFSTLKTMIFASDRHICRTICDPMLFPITAFDCELNDVTSNFGAELKHLSKSRMHKSRLSDSQRSIGRKRPSIAYLVLGWFSVFFLYISLIGCSVFRERPGSNCSDYEPYCGFLGARKECTYNSSGCRSCTCIPNPGTNLFEQQQRNP